MPISAILFGGRRRTTVPLVTQAFDWEHGVFLGSIMASETTAAAAGRGRQPALRPDGDAAVLRLQHGRLLRPLADDRQARPTPTNLPKIFFVNWFRRDEDGRFLWPGYGENSRVLKWVFERVAGDAERRSRRRSAYLPTPTRPRHRRARRSPTTTWTSCCRSTPPAGRRRSRRSASTSPSSATRLPAQLVDRARHPGDATLVTRPCRTESGQRRTMARMPRPMMNRLPKPYSRYSRWCIWLR